MPFDLFVAYLSLKIHKRVRCGGRGGGEGGRGAGGAGEFMWDMTDLFVYVRHDLFMCDMTYFYMT